MQLFRIPFATCTVLLLALVSTACNSAPPSAPVLAEAFAGPASLSLHADIDLKSPMVAKARHGDRLEILGQRRRWYKVRTSAGLEGWTSDRDLLDPGQMKRLRALAAETADMPSQGKATVFAPVNVHIEPNRQATSFIQVQPKETFDVVAHRVVQRGPAPTRRLLPPRPKPVAKKAKSKEKDNAPVVPQPPAPAPPPLPPDWLELSKSDAGEVDHDAPPALTDDFTLIRTAEGQSGWIITGAVYMKIPDEVAQYAEGHRITSYFAVGKTQDPKNGDNGETKPIWLWTTAERLGAPYYFDGFRVFTWNLRKHRYETAFIQRRETGYFPVQAKDGGFSVCLDRKGSRVRREYTLIGNSVRLLGEKSCEAPVLPDSSATPGFSVNLPAGQSGAGQPTGLMDRLRARWNRLFSRK